MDSKRLCVWTPEEMSHVNCARKYHAMKRARGARHMAPVDHISTLISSILLGSAPFSTLEIAASKSRALMEETLGVLSRSAGSGSAGAALCLWGLLDNSAAARAQFVASGLAASLAASCIAAPSPSHAVRVLASLARDHGGETPAIRMALALALPRGSTTAGLALPRSELVTGLADLMPPASVATSPLLVLPSNAVVVRALVAAALSTSEGGDEAVEVAAACASEGACARLPSLHGTCLSVNTCAHLIERCASAAAQGEAALSLLCDGRAQVAAAAAASAAATEKAATAKETVTGGEDEWEDVGADTLPPPPPHPAIEPLLDACTVAKRRLLPVLQTLVLNINTLAADERAELAIGAAKLRSAELRLEALLAAAAGSGVLAESKATFARSGDDGKSGEAAHAKLPPRARTKTTSLRLSASPVSTLLPPPGSRMREEIVARLHAEETAEAAATASAGFSAAIAEQSARLRELASGVSAPARASRPALTTAARLRKAMGAARRRR